MAGFPWADTLAALTGGSDIDGDTAQRAMHQVMAGEASPAQIAAFIVALRMKGETVEEMTGLVHGMRAASVQVELGSDRIVDIVGTGGDRSGTFNISTTAAFIVAGAGAKVAKHGNRSVSSQCGSGDVLEGLGVVIDLEPDLNRQLFFDTGFAFFLAPVYHPAMRHAGPVRRELGIPTVFNFLGPLTNPAGANGYAIGVSDPAMAERMIRVLAATGVDRAFVYYGEDGLDELTITGPSFIWRLLDGEVTHAEFTPEDFGMQRASLGDVLGGDVAENVSIVRDVLSGAPGPKRDIAVMNAAAGLVVAELADGFAEATELAASVIDEGRALAKLDEVVSRSRALQQ
jgi:anthranilate phosphoribosyltransferase